MPVGPRKNTKVRPVDSRRRVPVEGRHTLSRRAIGLRQPGWRATESQLALLRQQGLDALKVFGMPLRQLPEHVTRVIHAAETEVLTPPPSRGLQALREAIAAKLARESRATVDPDTNVVVTNGAMQAVNLVCRAVLDPGDEVIIPSPSFFFYGMVELAGAMPVYVRMDEDAAWAWDVEAVRKAFTNRTKLVILCNPVNPTGYVAPDSTIREICSLAAEAGVYVLVDESYDRMVYDGIGFISAATLSEFQDIIILVQSVTKSYAMAAWRVGYAVANAAISTAVTNLLEWENLYGCEVSQRAAAAAIAGPQDWLIDIPDEFQKYRDDVWAAISEMPELHVVKPHATPYMLVNLSQLSVSGDDFADMLVREFGVPATGGSHFDAPQHCRLGFGAPDADTRHELGRRFLEAARKRSVQASKA